MKERTKRVFTGLLLALLLIPAKNVPLLAADDFVRGDVNADGRVSTSDSVLLRRFLFGDDLELLPCIESGDYHDNGRVSLIDTIAILNYLFLGGQPPASPHPDPGPDDDDDTISCDSYIVTPPDHTDDVVRLEDIVASPGAEVEVPVFVTNDLPVEAFQLVLKYDPAVFEPLPGTRSITVEGGYYDELGDDASYVTTSPLNSDPPATEPGILKVGFVPNLVSSELALPPGEDQLVFKILGRVLDSVEPGTISRLEPTNGEDGEGVGSARMLNELTHEGEALLFSTVPVLEPATLQIVTDQTPFARGDSNTDRRLNIADAQYTLSFLFLGTAPPVCFDAADANADGTLDVSDPLATLTYLFLGGRALAPLESISGPNCR